MLRGRRKGRNCYSSTSACRIREIWFHSETCSLELKLGVCNKIEKGSIILKPLPDKVDSDLVEGVEEMLSEVLESVKLEGWQVDIKESSFFRGEAYDIIIKSHNIFCICEDFTSSGKSGTSSRN